ncbi:MAG: hypothetical protein EA369_08465 [Bradymonadales bacterium]|nr:MAG: hypothetical protein EA369_08465 [Bradymonadales bacterium]
MIQIGQVIEAVKEKPDCFYKERGAYHWARRLAHMLCGLMVIGLSFSVSSHQQFVTGLVIFSAAILIGDLLRIRMPQLNERLMSALKLFVREGEQDRLSGMPYYWWGISLSYLLFPLPIANFAVLFLSIGDPAAALVGSQSLCKGKTIPLVEGKSLQGSLAALIACAVASFLVLPIWLDSAALGMSERILLSFVCGLAASLGEILPLRTDDNLSLPLVSGAILWVYLAMSGYFLL